MNYDWIIDPGREFCSKPPAVKHADKKEKLFTWHQYDTDTDTDIDMKYISIGNTSCLQPKSLKPILLSSYKNDTII